MKRSKPKPKAKNPRRVVLGVGHPWIFHLDRSIGLTSAQDVWPAIPLNYRYLGNWNRIRLIAEVLE